MKKKNIIAVGLFVFMTCILSFVGSSSAQAEEVTKIKEGSLYQGTYQCGRYKKNLTKRIRKNMKSWYNLV